MRTGKHQSTSRRGQARLLRRGIAGKSRGRKRKLPEYRRTLNQLIDTLAKSRNLPVGKRHRLADGTLVWFGQPDADGRLRVKSQFGVPRGPSDWQVSGPDTAVEGARSGKTFTLIIRAGTGQNARITFDPG